MAAVSTSLPAVSLAASTPVVSPWVAGNATPRLPARPSSSGFRRILVIPGSLRSRVVAAAAGESARGEWAQTSANVEYVVPESTVAGQVPNRQYEQFHMNSQFSTMQPASLTATYGFRGINLPGVLKGPSSVILMIAMMVFAAFTAVRKMLQRRTKSCDTCKSYGIVRCTLCGGQGSIAWEGKWSHTTLCPGCFGKRHVRCESCGGMHNRSRFGHVTSGSVDVFPGSEAANGAPVPSISSAERMRD